MKNKIPNFIITSSVVRTFPLADAFKQKLKGLVGRRWGFESGRQRVFYSQRVKMPSAARSQAKIKVVHQNRQRARRN